MVLQEQITDTSPACLDRLERNASAELRVDSLSDWEDLSDTLEKGLRGQDSTNEKRDENAVQAIENFERVKHTSEVISKGSLALTKKMPEAANLNQYVQDGKEVAIAESEQDQTNTEKVETPRSKFKETLSSPPSPVV